LDSLYFLIPVSVFLVVLIVAIYLWSVRSGQFDDLEGPGHSILYEEEKNADNIEEKSAGSKKISDDAYPLG